MNDPQKSAEAVKKIQELQNKIKQHSSRISQIEYEKNNKIKYCDQQIKSEQDQINQHNKKIDELKRQI
jgi:chromosome segregation ATPase